MDPLLIPPRICSLSVGVSSFHSSRKAARPCMVPSARRCFPKYFIATATPLVFCSVMVLLRTHQDPLWADSFRSFVRLPSVFWRGNTESWNVFVVVDLNRRYRFSFDLVRSIRNKQRLPGQTPEICSR